MFITGLIILSPVFNLVVPFVCLLTSELNIYSCAPKFLIGTEIVYSGIFKYLPEVIFYVLKEIPGLVWDCARGNLLSLLTG